MLTSVNYGYWEFWSVYDPANGLYGNQKCIFDGINKLIFVDPSVTEIDIKTDVYSNWKEWMQVRDNSKFLPAIRSTGGDPIPGTSSSTGDIYFLQNGWRFVVDFNKMRITGVLYSEDYDTAYFDSSLNPLYAVTVSSLVLAPSQTDVPTATDTANAVWNSETRTLTSIDATVNFDEATLDSISSAVWNKAIADMLTAGSAGERLQALLTVNKYLGLK